MRCEHLLGPGQRLRVSVCGLGVRGKVISAVLTLHADPAPYGPQRNSEDPRVEEETRKEGKSLMNYNLIKFISRWIEFSKSWW